MTEDTQARALTQRECQKTVRLRDYVSHQILRLQGGYLAGTSASTAALAQLRNGASKPVGDDLSLLQFTTAGLYPEGTQLPDGPTDRERAAYTAVTLYALHQQSERTQRMHRQGDESGRGDSIGAAAGKLYQGDKAPGVIRRFEGLGTAVSWSEITQHSRGLVQLLRVAKIPLDYGRFAEDLLALQEPERVTAVRNRWGRDFYRRTQVEISDDTPHL